MMTKVLIPTLALAAALLAGCGKPAETPAPATSVVVSDAWCRVSPNGARAGGCYATLTAQGGDDRLVSVSTNRAESAQVHEMSTRDGMMTMGEMTDGLPLPAGQAQSLAPGSNHIMLMGLTAPLVAGDVVSMTLTFEHAPAYGARFEVRAAPPAA